MASSLVVSPKSSSFSPVAHRAAYAVRDAEALLDAADARIAAKAPAPYPTLTAALMGSHQTPQYRRTFIQGCACSTGLAGGGCCPGGATVAAQGGVGMHAGSASTMVPMGLFAGALGLFGVYSGAKVIRNTGDALRNLDRVQAHLEPQRGNAALQQAQLTQYPQMPQAQEAAQHVVEALDGYRRDIDISKKEQRFNRAVPGLLQVVAAVTTTLAAVNEMGMGFLGTLGGTIVGALGSGLFAAYGGAMAAKSLHEYRKARAIAPVARSEGMADDYRLAVNRHLQARVDNHKRQGLAWGGVALAGVFGTVVAAGAVVFPFAWAAVAGVALVAGGWAMWQNSRTRYVPHLPISPHVQRDDLVTAEQRAQTWRHLGAQDQAIKAAVIELTARQNVLTKARYHVERLFKPQCGPNAFRVLSNKVQKSPESQRAEYERLEIAALTTYVQSEKALLLGRFQGKSDELLFRVLEMKRLVDPCCEAMTKTAKKALAPGALSEPIYTEASENLRDEAARLEAGARKLAVLDQLSDALANLAPLAGKLSAPDDQHLDAEQERWLYTRLNLLQLSGTLGDAVSKAFIEAHPEHFSRNDKPGSLPINNVYVLPEQMKAFALNIAADLDGAFVHAFFNPRRIEAEMDFILDRELTTRSDRKPTAPGAAPAAPKCDGGTCCR